MDTGLVASSVIFNNVALGLRSKEEQGQKRDSDFREPRVRPLWLQPQGKRQQLGKDGGQPGQCTGPCHLTVKTG